VLTLHGEGLVLREWTHADLAVMSDLFDEPSIDAWTPLASPFDLDAARSYLDRAHASRDSGEALQLAITLDGTTPLGEVLLFGSSPGVGELAYAVGVQHRGRRLAARAVVVAMAHGRAELGMREFHLNVSPQNPASQKVAEACGFVLAGEPSFVRERKGRRVELVLWRRRQPGWA
jgi:RimJ/RimL family protein N-acetyltransferase